MPRQATCRPTGLLSLRFRAARPQRRRAARQRPAARKPNRPCCKQVTGERPWTKLSEAEREEAALLCLSRLDAPPGPQQAAARRALLHIALGAPNEAASAPAQVAECAKSNAVLVKTGAFSALLECLAASVDPLLAAAAATTPAGTASESKAAPEPSAASLEPSLRATSECLSALACIVMFNAADGDFAAALQRQQCAGQPLAVFLFGLVQPPRSRFVPLGKLAALLRWYLTATLGPLPIPNTAAPAKRKARLSDLQSMAEIVSKQFAPVTLSEDDDGRWRFLACTELPVAPREALTLLSQSVHTPPGDLSARRLLKLRTEGGALPAPATASERLFRQLLPALPDIVSGLLLALSGAVPAASLPFAACEPPGLGPQPPSAVDARRYKELLLRNVTFILLRLIKAWKINCEDACARASSRRAGRRRPVCVWVCAQAPLSPGC